jgi:hypothetical protein
MKIAATTCDIVPDEKEQKGANERHKGNHQEDRGVRYAINQPSGKQRKEQAAETSRNAGESGCAAYCVLRKKIGDGSIHIGGRPQQLIRRHFRGMRVLEPR